MNTDKGPALNQRVWTLFEKAGFQTKPNSNNPDDEEKIKLSADKTRKVDLFAELPNKGVVIIGENKSRGKLDKSFSAYVHDCEQLTKASKANVFVFVSDDKEIDAKDKKYAQERGVIVWGNDELEYYETLVDTIGEYAKYEILHAMGVSTREQSLTHDVLALKIRQPFSDSENELFIFTTSPEMLLKTCVVLRKAAGITDAYQRMVKKSRLSKIAKFVTQKDSVLPPNIVVHLNEEIDWTDIDLPEHNKKGRKINLTRKNDYSLVLLHIPLKFASMEIIDGQHRLFGFAHANVETQERFNLVVLGLANMSPKKKTETFVAINDNARRMDPNLVAYLKLTEDETECQKDAELMAIKVVYKLNQVTPFKKKIRILDTGKEKLTIKNFAGMELKSLIGEKGHLRKHYPHSSDEYVKILRMYFSTLQSIFNNEWNEPETYIVFSNRGISAFLKLLKSLLKTEQKPLEQKTIHNYLLALKNGWTKSWKTKELENSYVGSQGRGEFHRDLVNAIKKTYPEIIQ